MGCGELTFSACLAFSPHPHQSFFFLSADSVSRFSHLYFHTLPRRLPSLTHLVHLCYLPRLTGHRLLSHRRLCSCVVLHLGGKGPSSVILSLLPGHYLVITITVGGRSLARGDQMGGGMSGWTVLGGQPRRCQHAAWAGKEVFSSFLSKHLFFLQEICREINNPRTFLVFEKQLKKEV